LVLRQRVLAHSLPHHNLSMFEAVINAVHKAAPNAIIAFNASRGVQTPPLAGFAPTEQQGIGLPGCSCRHLELLVRPGIGRITSP
jgi:hypothetical protein